MSSAAVPELLPARILNEHVYCPRLAYLEWVDRQFKDNADTAEGTFVHRRVDRPRSTPPEPGEALEDGDEDPPPSTSIELSSERLGLIAKLDLLEPSGETVVPIEYKRGRPRAPDDPLWEPELAQVCAHVMLLRDAGYSVDHAEVYFAETRTRHRVEIPDELVARTSEAISAVRANAAANGPPPPLVDSPKCPRCSLVTLCLPDEVGLLQGERSTPPRRLVAGDSAASLLYATTPGSRLTKRGGRAVLLEDGEETASARLIDISHLLRMHQHRAAAIGAPELAGALVAGKIRNSRTLVRRHGGEGVAETIAQLARLAVAAEAERSIESLLGIEGTAARLYFGRFAELLHSPSAREEFDFERRNRRPPLDPVNAMLSFVYGLLVKDVAAALIAVGLDPYVGVFHRPHFGRPGLALDLAEEFRPLVGDSTVLMAVNNGELEPSDFVRRAGAVGLTSRGRKKLIATYERRMRTELVHPAFKYRASYRRSLEIQARLLAAVLVGDIPAYRPLTTR